jgi:PKD repeat protein
VSAGGEIRDRDGGVREYRSSVTVKNLPPVASGGNAQTQFWGLPVTLFGSATDPSSVDQFAGFVSSWNFGDGQSASGANAVHAFAKPGSYAAKFSATDKDGATGTASVAITIGKRGAALAYVGATSAPFGFLTLQARLSDSVDRPTAQLAGHSVLFMLGAQSFVAITDATGLASVSASSVAPGSYPLAVSLPNDAYYNAVAGRATVAVTRSLGRVTGTGLVFAAGGSGSLSVASASIGVTGTLSYSSASLSLSATSLGPLGLRSDLRAAWLNGVDSAGRKLVVYAEDNGTGATDIYKLWVNGALVNGTGALTAGDVVIGP